MLSEHPRLRAIRVVAMDRRLAGAGGRFVGAPLWGGQEYRRGQCDADFIRAAQAFGSGHPKFSLATPGNQS